MPFYIAKQSTDERGNNNRNVIINHVTEETVKMTLQNRFEKTAAGTQELITTLSTVRGRVKDTFFAVEEAKIGKDTFFQVISEEELKKFAEAKIPIEAKK